MASAQPWRKRRLLATSAGVACAAIRSASTSASSSASPVHAVARANPFATASVALSPIPESIIQLACCMPTRRGSNQLLAASALVPSETNGIRISAPSSTTTTSQWSKIVAPNPTATPFTAATRGLAKRASCSSNGSKWRPSSPAPSGWPITERSTPAEKARPLPVSTHSDPVVSPGGGERLGEAVVARWSEGVQLLGAIEGQDPDPIPILGGNGELRSRLVHRPPPRLSGPANLRLPRQPRTGPR